MEWQRRPRLRPTLVFDVNNEGSVNDKDEGKDMNAALAVSVNDEGVGRWDGALAR